MALHAPAAAMIAAIRAAVRRSAPVPPAERVAAVLARYLDHPELLAPQHRRTDHRKYAQNVLHVEPDESFSVVALVWQPGQATRIHDHVAWCTVGVYEGIERETSFAAETCAAGERRLHTLGTRDNPRGSVDGLTCGNDIHRVFNPGPSLAISLHVYGANIAARGSSVHTWYDETPEEANWAI
jgi:predicted metal-dependent enzyme (double-stranded beta helix superfamily)